MNKSTYFYDYDGPGWPESEWLAPYFLTDAGRRVAFDDPYGNDSWALRVDGLHGTGHLPEFNGRVDLVLIMVGHLDHGVLLCHQRWGPKGTRHYSKGNFSRLRDWVETKHGDLRPVGLFIPFEAAWRAVKEFMETDGALPKSIPWIDVRDLPPGTFPSPVAHLTKS
jgi:hypothetical protein